MSGFARKITAAFVAASLCAVPTAAIGAAPVAPVAAAPVASAPVSPWLTLSAMTTSSSAATSAAVAQGDDGRDFPIVPLAVILITIGVGIWILLKDDEDDSLGISPD